MVIPFLVETHHFESPVPHVILALETSLPTEPKCMVLMETDIFLDDSTPFSKLTGPELSSHFPRFLNPNWANHNPSPKFVCVCLLPKGI